MKILAAVWKLNTRWGPWEAKSHNEKLSALEGAVAETAAHIPVNIPAEQTVRAILVAPEYAFKLTQDDTHPAMQLSKQQAVDLKAKLAQLSQQHTKILLVPGSISFRREYDLSQQEEFPRLKKSFNRLKTHSKELNQLYTRSEDSRPFGKASYPEKIYKEDQQQAKANIKKIQKLAKAANEQSPTKGKVSVAKNYAYGYLDRQKVFTCRKRGEVGEIDNSDTITVFINGPESTVKQIDALRYGVEICKDAANGYMRHLGGDIDIHIVLSAGLGNTYISHTASAQVIIHADEMPEECGVFTKAAGWLNTKGSVKVSGHDLDFYEFEVTPKV